MKKQMNVNENLLQLALRESQDTNMFKLSFDSIIYYLKDLAVKLHDDNHMLLFRKGYTGVIY